MPAGIRHADVTCPGYPEREHEHGPGVDDVPATSVATYPGYAAYYHIKDHLGSVVALVDSTGTNMIESYEYDAWGNVTVFTNGALASKSKIGNRFLFQGREYSWKTKLYYFRARWYDPTTGRWLSNDPIGISGGLNQFVFVGNNPVNFFDPLGLDIYYEAGAGGHSGLIIDNPKSPTGRTVYDFAPRSGGRNDWTLNILYGPSKTTLRPWPGNVDSFLRIPTMPEQDARVIRLAELAEQEGLPHAILFNNCAHMARMIIDGAGIPAGNRFRDSPDTLLKDLQDYLNQNREPSNKDCE